MERNQFTFYRSYLDAIRRLSADEQGEILWAICVYALDEVMPENLSPIAETVFTLVKPTLDAGRKKALSGQKGGQGGSAPCATSPAKAHRKQTKSKQEGEIEVEYEKKMELEDECHSTSNLPNYQFVPPTVQEVAGYCEQNDYSVDAAKFVDYYTANGWQVGKNKMKDWKAAVRNWNRKETNNGHDKYESIFGSIGQTF